MAEDPERRSHPDRRYLLYGDYAEHLRDRYAHAPVIEALLHNLRQETRQANESLEAVERKIGRLERFNQRLLGAVMILATLVGSGVVGVAIEVLGPHRGP